MTDYSKKAPEKSDGESMGKLLDLLTAVKWDLKSRLNDGAAAPAELETHIGRMFEEIDSSIDSLRSIIREQGLPV